MTLSINIVIELAKAFTFSAKTGLVEQSELRRVKVVAYKKQFGAASTFLRNQ